MTFVKLEQTAPGGSFFPFFIMQQVLTKDISEILGKKLSEMYLVMENDDYVTILGEKDEWEGVCRIALKKLLDEKDFGKKVEEGLRKSCSELKEFCEGISDVSGMDNNELLNAYNEFCRITRKVRVWGWIPNLVNLYSENIMVLAKEGIEKEGGDAKDFSILTTPNEMLWASRARIDALKLAKDVKEDGNYEKIDEYLDRYRFITYYYKGPGMSREELVSDLKEKMKDVDKKLEEAQGFYDRIKFEQKEIMDRLKLSSETLFIVSEARRMMLLKGYRKDYHNYSNYKIKPVLEEIGKRLNVSFDIVRNLLPQEIEEGLKKGEVGDHSGRLKLFITKQVDGVNYEASDAEEMLQSVLSQEIEVRNEWKGQCAYPGKVSGTVKLVDSRKDMDKFQEGDVLVSHTTNPDLVPAMEKASAIITDMGGLTSHAAIVSREMKKPCVVGSQNASKQLKDGDRVEVDADKGIVKKI